MQYQYYSEGQFKVARNPVTGTKCRTGQLNHKFVEQQLIDDVWTDIGGNDAIAGEGCRFREGVRNGDYVVDVELEVAGFLLAENDGWENIGGAVGAWTPQRIAALNKTAWYNPSLVNGAVRDVNGRESIWWDLFVGNSVYGSEQSSGDLIGYAVYKITATQANFFYAGCAVGDIYPCEFVKTLDANNKVQRVLGNHLTQPVAALRPINGVFDGIANFMRTPPITLDQPTTIMGALNLKAWADGCTLIDGLISNSGALRGSGETPRLIMRAGVQKGYISPVLNTVNIIGIEFNGANSELQLNDGDTIFGDAGLNNMGGIIIGRMGSNEAGYANLEGKEFVFCNEILDLNNKRKLYDYLNVSNLVGKQRTNFNRGKLVLSFDDGYNSFHDIVYPLFVNKGITGTCYIIPSYMVPASSFMSWSDIQELIAGGMDIQCHTNTHPDLITLTEAEVLAEYNAVNAAFIANGLSVPTNTAYPFGHSNANVEAWTSTLRNGARGTDNGFVWKNSDRFDLPSYEISLSAQADSAIVFPLLDNANENNLAVILYAHELDKAGNITPAQLTAIIDYAQSLNMDIISATELLNLMDV